MKKLLALMLALGMTVSLAACGGSTDSADTTASESETTEESTDAAETEETADAVCRRFLYGRYLPAGTARSP